MSLLSDVKPIQNQPKTISTTYIEEFMFRIQGELFKYKQDLFITFQ